MPLWVSTPQKGQLCHPVRMLVGSTRCVVSSLPVGMANVKGFADLPVEIAVTDPVEPTSIPAVCQTSQ